MRITVKYKHMTASPTVPRTTVRQPTDEIVSQQVDSNRTQDSRRVRTDFSHNHPYVGVLIPTHATPITNPLGVLTRTHVTP